MGDEAILAALGVKAVAQRTVETKIQQVMEAQTRIHEAQREQRRSEQEQARLRRQIEIDAIEPTLQQKSKDMLKKESAKARGLAAEIDRLDKVIELGNDMEFMNDEGTTFEDRLGEVPAAPESSVVANIAFGMKTFGDGVDDTHDNGQNQGQKSGLKPPPEAPAKRRRLGEELKEQREKKAKAELDDLFGEISDDEKPPANGWAAAIGSSVNPALSTALPSSSTALASSSVAATSSSIPATIKSEPKLEAMSAEMHTIPIKRERKGSSPKKSLKRTQIGGSSSSRAIPNLSFNNMNSVNSMNPTHSRKPSPNTMHPVESFSPRSSNLDSIAGTTKAQRRLSEEAIAGKHHVKDQARDIIVIEDSSDEEKWADVPMALRQQEALRVKTESNRSRLTADNRIVKGGSSAVLSQASSTQYAYPSAPFAHVKYNQTKKEKQTGHQSPRGGHQSPRGGHQSPRGGHQSPRGGHQSPRDGSPEDSSKDSIFGDLPGLEELDQKKNRKGSSLVIQEGKAPKAEAGKSRSGKVRVNLDDEEEDGDEDGDGPQSEEDDLLAAFPLDATQIVPRSTGGLDEKRMAWSAKKKKQKLNKQPQDLLQTNKRLFGETLIVHNGKKMTAAAAEEEMRKTERHRKRESDRKRGIIPESSSDISDDGLGEKEKKTKTLPATTKGYKKTLKSTDENYVFVPPEVRKKPAHLRTQEETNLLARARNARQRAFDDINDKHYQEGLLKHAGNVDIEADTLAENKMTWIVQDQLRIPNYIWDNLYGYQKTAVKWMHHLHERQVGGILADEMGLGKTIQIAAFLAALHCSGILQTITVRRYGTGPPRTGGVLIACPTTLIEQWYDELKAWYPVLRVSLMHQVSPEVRQEMAVAMVKCNGILITSYETLRLSSDMLFELPWVYTILDEGHKIRNPDAAITMCVKQLDTPHRLVLTGTPIQNRLVELWSIFDFIQPGLLGTYPVFQQQFSDVIEAGGQMSATPRMAEAAFQAAKILRELTLPWLLRRTKADVQDIVRLPPKQEQILFCNLTPQQYEVYCDFLKTDKVRAAKESGNSGGKTGVPHAFFILSVLRKLCNHPDLLLKDHPDLKPADYGNHLRSGKMKVLDEILKAWKGQGHKVLLFTQAVQQLVILQERITDHLGYQALRMDGTTPVLQRQRLISQFNETPEIFVMIMTTKVGGVGLNITGANRVVLYDPDWNPMTDIQARERAWRIGQQREVIVYRLVSVGTVEEKIYHRQVFKHFLSQKILNDPRQKRFMKMNDARDLFEEPPPPPDYVPTAGKKKEVRYQKLWARIDPNMVNEYGEMTARQDVETLKILGDLENNPVPEANQTSESTAAESNRILSNLLDPNKQLIRTTMSHDQIEQPALDEGLIIHGQQRARQALQMLEESRNERRQFAFSDPTWTGKSGVAGRGKKPARGLPSEVSVTTTDMSAKEKKMYQRMNQAYQEEKERKARWEEVSRTVDKNSLSSAMDAFVSRRGGGSATSKGLTTNTAITNGNAMTHANSGRGVRRPNVGDGTEGSSFEQPFGESDLEASSSSGKNHRNGVSPPGLNGIGTAFNPQNKKGILSSVQQSIQIRKGVETFNVLNKELRDQERQQDQNKQREYRMEGKIQRNFRERQEVEAERKIHAQEEIAAGFVPQLDKKLANSVLAFFLNKRVCPYGSATTTQVIDHFEGQVSGHHKALFKDVLREICTLEKQKNPMMPSIWTLKPEYRQN